MVHVKRKSEKRWLNGWFVIMKDPAVILQWITSLELADYLLSKNLTLVGTLRANKACIPKEMLKNRSRTVQSSLFGFMENKTIVSYVPKKDKAVILLSTMHHDNAISDDQNKPDIIKYYNSSKGGVNVMDKMASHFTTKRATKRWPVAVFYNILNVCALEAYVLYTEHNKEAAIRKDNRRKFLQELGKQLCMPNIQERSENPLIYRNFNTKNGIEAMLGENIRLNTPASHEPSPARITPRGSDERLKIQGSCHVCSEQRKPRKKTSK